MKNGLLTLSVALGVLLTSCKKDDDEVTPNDNGTVITNNGYVVTDSANADFSIVFKHLDKGNQFPQTGDTITYKIESGDKKFLFTERVDMSSVVDTVIYLKSENSSIKLVFDWSIYYGSRSPQYTENGVSETKEVFKGKYLLFEDSYASPLYLIDLPYDSTK